jgi:hypothetical protein
MADQLTTGWTDLLYEMRGPLQSAYPKAYVMLAEFKRDTRQDFTGNKVRVPIFAAPLQGAHGLAEGGTITTPQIDITSHAEVLVAHMAIPISLSPELIKQSKDNSAVKAMASKVKRARESMSRTANEMIHGAGDGQLGEITDGATSLTVTLATGAAKVSGLARQLYPGRIVDVRTRATGADPGQGLKRKIASVTKNTDGSINTVTFDTNAFGGGSGNIVHTSADGIFIVDTWGNAVQGIQQIGGTTGIFEVINRATAGNDFWKGTDGRAGVTTLADPTLSMLDGGFLQLGERTDLDKIDFFVGDPGVILKYQQLFYSAVKYENPGGKLKTGFSGPVYNGQVLVNDFDHQLGALSGITKESLQMYGYSQGPDWDEETGAMFQRFSRTRNVEAWLVDDLQLGAHECRTMVRWANLNRAS